MKRGPNGIEFNKPDMYTLAGFSVAAFAAALAVGISSQVVNQTEKRPNHQVHAPATYYRTLGAITGGVVAPEGLQSAPPAITITKGAFGDLISKVADSTSLF